MKFLTKPPDFSGLRRRELIPREIITSSVMIVALIFTGGLVLFLHEVGMNAAFGSVTDTWWWSFVTVTTTSFGTTVPQTFIGKLIAALMLMAGIIGVSIITASISSILVARKIQTQRGLMDISVKNHIIICGYFHTIRNLIQSLIQASPGTSIVLLNDYDQDGIDMIMSEFARDHIYFVRGNPSNESFLRKAKIENARTILVLPDISEGRTGKRVDELSLMTVLTIRRIMPEIKLYAHISDPELVQPVKRAGVDGFLVSDEFSGEMMASFALQPGTTQAVKSMMGVEYANRLRSMDIPGHLVGKTYQEVLEYFKSERNVLVIGFMSQEAEIDVDSILSNDMSALDLFIQKKFREARLLEEKADQMKLNMNPPLSYKVVANDLALVIGG